MRADEAAGLGALAAMALGGGVQRISQAHAGIAGRAFGSVSLGLDLGLGRGRGRAVAPVRVLHDGVSRVAYGGVRVALTAGARLAGAVGAGFATGGASLADRPGTRGALGVLNGLHGDALLDRAQALALPMRLRWRGHDLAPERGALAVAYPQASARVVVLLHGLVETEDAWRFHAERQHGDRHTTYGTLLERDLGCTPVYVRYNTGLRVSENGRELDLLLDRLVDAWPVPVRDLVLLGHSMGGLVARSALAQAGDGTAAGDRRWPGLVADTITLGTPHLGAPLEQAVDRLAHHSRRLPETRWLADQLDARSAGIKDLRHGSLLEADLDRRSRVPLHPTARHFVVLATVGRPDSWVGRLVGDLLVRPDSACGETGDDDRFDLAADRVRRLPGLHHLDLLNHPEVYAAIRTWLQEPVSQAASGPGPEGQQRVRVSVSP